MFIFTPRKLIAAKEEIVKQHMNIGEPKDIQLSFEFVKLIKRLADLSEEDAKREALILSKAEMSYIASYIPTNYYNVKMDNLFLIFQIRSTSHLCEVLYYNWQNFFERRECNEFLITLLETNQQFKELIQRFHFTVGIYTSILKNKHVAVAYGREVNRMAQNQNIDFKSCMENVGVLKSSRLFKECEYLFYTFCDRDDYFTDGDKKILETIKKYGREMQLCFLENFLQKLSIRELKGFTYLAEYFLKSIGSNRSIIENYFKGFQFLSIRKYMDWINSFTIKKLFGKDERSVFWEQFRFESVVRYDYSDSIVMEFENHVGIEFLGKAMGPFYIYEKKYFEKNIRRSFRSNSYDNTSLRQYLYHRNDYNNNSIYFGYCNAIRLVHIPNPGWEYAFEDMVRINCITEKVKDDD